MYCKVYDVTFIRIYCEITTTVKLSNVSVTSHSYHFCVCDEKALTSTLLASYRFIV